MWTTVPFIQESFSNCDILFRAWFDTDRIWVTFLRMVRLCLYFLFILNYYYYLNVPCCFLNTLFCSECVLFHACTLPLFFHRCEEIPPRQHASLPWTSIAGTCMTWQRTAFAAMRDFNKHDFRAHTVDLFHTKKKTVKEGGKKILPLASSEMDWFQRHVSFQKADKLSVLLLNYIGKEGQSMFATRSTRLDTP